MQNMIKRTHISEDGKYRYTLYREWDESKPTILFIMLNPSTADDKEDDQTMKRVIDYSKLWGYGSVHVGNLNAYRSKDPKILKTIEDPEGKENITHVKSLVERVEKVIYAWGNAGKEPKWLSDIVPTPYCIYTTKDGNPRHPSRSKIVLQPVVYTRK
jgi:hypothetical protein